MMKQAEPRQALSIESALRGYWTAIPIYEYK